MELRIPQKGEVYRHFKGNLYEVLAIAMHTETEETMVVYREVHGQATYVRPLGMFISKVNKEKYPTVTQEFRFELVQETNKEELDEKAESSTDNFMIMEFLELHSAYDKIQYLQSVRGRITEEFIEVVAQSLDFVENAGTLEERYQALIRYLHTVTKYEYGRRK